MTRTLRNSLRFDRLEDRITPVKYVHVVSGNDSGSGTLRDAMTQADADTRIVIDSVINPGGSDQNIHLFQPLEMAGLIVIDGGGHSITAQSGDTGFSFITVAAGSDVTISDLTISGVSNPNSSDGLGSAIEVSGHLTLQRCLLTGNEAVNGAAVAVLDGGSATITNCTFTANSTSGDAGAISNAGDATVTFCTFAGNTSGGTGPAIGNSGHLTLVNNAFDGGGSLIATGGNSNAALDASAANIVNGDVTHSDGTSDTSGVLATDPLLADLKTNGGRTRTMALKPGSHALNGGLPVAGVLTDARGVGRDPDHPDLGAYEVQQPLSPVGVPVDFSDFYAPHPSASTAEAFVKGLYQALLLRAGSSTEVGSYIDQLVAGVPRTVIADHFVNSPENRGNQVTFFYRYFLNRTPDPAGLNFYVQRLQNGEDESAIMKNFILSPEYTGKNNNTQFTNTMYYALLGRYAAQAEIDFYVGQLSAGTKTRDQVLANFLRSPESLRRVVQSYYVSYLKRYGDPGATGLDGWVTRLGQPNPPTFGAVAVGFLASTEFYNNAGANL